MDFAAFFAKIPTQDSLSLIGPLLGQPHRASKPVIYVDGGIKFRDSRSSFPSLSVGDGDSSPAALDVTLPAQKDVSDLGYVLSQLPAHVRSVELEGFWGGRRDHEWAIAGELHRFLAAHPDREAVWKTDGQPQTLGFGAGTWTFEAKGTFSIFTLEETEVTIAGDCDYPLAMPTRFRPLSSLGLSNSGRGTITLKVSKPAFVFLA